MIETTLEKKEKDEKPRMLECENKKTNHVPRNMCIHSFTFWRRIFPLNMNKQREEEKLSRRGFVKSVHVNQIDDSEEKVYSHSVSL